MPQSSAPIVNVNLSDADWRDSFGDEAGVLGDLDGSAYKITLPTNSDTLLVGSATQRSVARVAGFVHRIPTGETEPLTIPVASGAARTDIVALRYDPAFTGLPGPVRLTRVAGTSAGLPAYDAAPPGIEDLPLWSITRQPGQALSQAAVTRLFPRLAPVLEAPVGSPLPTSSPLGSVLRRGTEEFRRVLDDNGVPVWSADVVTTANRIRVGPPGGQTITIDEIHQLYGLDGAAPAKIKTPYGFTALPAPTDATDPATRGYVDGRTADTGWVDLGLAAGWTRITSRCRIRYGLFHFTVHATRASWGNPTTLFTLSTAHRPAHTHYFAGLYQGQTHELGVSASGVASVNEAGTGGIVVSGAWPIG